MMEIESLVAYPEEVIKEKAANLLGQFNINYNDGYVFCGNLNEAYCEIADIFYDMRAEMESALKDNLDKSDMKNYAINVHALKSNARSLGITELADIAYEHELKSKAGDVSFCNDNWNRLVESWDKSLASLAVYLKAMNIDKGIDFDNMNSGSDSGCETGAVSQTDSADSLLNDRDYQEAKAEIQALIDSGMEDIARDVIDELISGETNPVKIEQLKSMLN